jgi:pSer/pThr/pTyr-binding forkhead associated (FHA) protein
VFFSRGAFVEYELGGRKQQVPLKKDPFTIGSASDCELTVQHELVADRHFRLVRNGKGWNLKLIGRNPVLINGVLLRDADRNLSNGDVFEIGGVLAFTYRDPDEKSEGSGEGEVEEAPASRRPFYILLFSLFISTTMLLIFLVYLGKSGPTESKATVASVIEGMPACIVDAATLIREGKVVRSVDPKGVYWRAAEAVAAAAGPDAAIDENLVDSVAGSDVESIRAALRTTFSRASLFMDRSNSERAKAEYSRVRDLVPDINCRANSLAAKMASDGGK